MIYHFKILDKYTPCIDKKCINSNNTFVKKVFKDLNYTPLCNKCLVKHRKALREIKNSIISLSDKEILKVYCNTMFEV